MGKKVKKIYEAVEIPDKYAYIAPRGKYRYVFYLEDMVYNKDIKRGNEPKQTIIGKPLDGDTHMIPNDNYFKLLKIGFEKYQEADEDFNDRLSFGGYMMIDNACSKIGCLDSLKEVYPKDYMKIYAYAQYMLTSGSSVSQHFNDFAYRYYTGLSNNISDSTLSLLFHERITNESIDLFQRSWIKKWKDNCLKDIIGEKTIIYLDSTNNTTSALEVENKEMGKAKKKDGNPQVNTAMFASYLNKHPLAIKQYRGSEIDNVSLKELNKYADSLGLTNTFFVCDRGYHSENNVKTLLKKNKFALMCSEATKATVDNILTNQGIVYNVKHKVPGFNAYSISKKSIDFYGIELRIIVFVDNDRKNIETSNLWQRIEKEEKLLKSKKEYEDWMENHKYFIITKNKRNNGFKYERDEKAIQDELDKCGFFVVITNDYKLTDEELLIIMRQRNQIELMFKILKTDFDLEKLRVYNDQAFLAKTFIGFFAEIIKTEILNELQSFLSQKSHSSESFNTVIKCMNKLEIEYKDKRWVPHYSLSAKQKDIIKSLGITEDKILKSIKKVDKTIIL